VNFEEKNQFLDDRRDVNLGSKLIRGMAPPGKKL
jgi:hypothetical protein